MTYRSALEWAENHLPMIDYDDFEEWYDAIKEEFSTKALTDSDDFYNDARESWDESIGEIISDENSNAISNEQELPSRGKGINVGEGALITNKGIEPVKVINADIQQQQIKEEVIITEKRINPERLIQQPQIKPTLVNKFSNAINKFVSGIGGLFRRKK